MSMQIRPQDLPEIRAEALLWQASHADRLVVGWADMAEDYKGAKVPEFARQMWRYEIERLGSAELFYVTRPMAELALAAATSLPSFRISPADMPSRAGLVVFEEPLPFGIHWDDGDTSATRAMLWGESTKIVAAGGLLVTTYLDSEEFARSVSSPEATGYGGPSLAVMPGSTFGSGFGDKSWDAQELMATTSAGELLPVLLAVWLLMRQPLARTAEVEVDRAARKRLRRVGQEPKPVRVIELWRPKSSSEPGDGESNYHHQWIVRGHWRQQWHPKRGVHRPVWIAPHIKGPEGAPLIGGEKVYALKR